MADIKLNFSSQWPTIQVAKVVTNPTGGQKISHNLGFPPLAIAYTTTPGYGTAMNLETVSDNTVFSRGSDYLVIYNVDISANFDYTSYTNAVGDPVKDETSGSIDLRKFLLHSRAVGPMLLSVHTKKYTTSDTTLTYTSPLNYPTFQFGYLRSNKPDLGAGVGTWIGAPLAGHAWPVLRSDGYTSTLLTAVSDGKVMADVGSIITLRNPAIITNNTTSVTI